MTSTVGRHVRRTGPGDSQVSGHDGGVDLDDLPPISGLAWFPPFDFSEPVDEPEVEMALVRIEAEAAVINAAEREIQRSMGTLHRDGSGAVERMVASATTRFGLLPHAGCPHHLCDVITDLYAGPILGAACQQPLCAVRLAGLAESCVRHRWCGLCDRRDRWRSVTLAITHVSAGRLWVPVHVACLHGDGEPGVQALR
jgi:hypothetical protein